MPRIHHVNLGVPPELIEAEADFLVAVIGYRRAVLDPAAAQAGANWFDADDGTQIHLSPDPEHVAGRRAHTALVVGDEIDLIEKRLEAAGAMGRPQVILPGAIDVVNFGKREMVPARFAGRRFVAHTPTSTLMRTSIEENVAIAQFMADKLNRATGPSAVVVPTRCLRRPRRERSR